MASIQADAVDPFDLPEWLGVSDVVWSAESGLRNSHVVRGRLSAGSGDANAMACDLLAVDEAYPVSVCSDAVREQAHREWHHGQVQCLDVETRLTLAVPGTRLDPDLALDALSRLARAVGGDPERYALLLRIGTEKRSGRA